MEVSLQEILQNSKAPIKNGVQVIQVEKYKGKIDKIMPHAPSIQMLEQRPLLSALIKDHKFVFTDK